MSGRERDWVGGLLLFAIPMAVGLFVLRDRPLLLRFVATIGAQAVGLVVLILLRSCRKAPAARSDREDAGPTSTA